MGCNLVKALKQTQGLAPLEDVYKKYVWTAVRSFCQGAGPASCQQSPVLGYGGAGNTIRLAPTRRERPRPAGLEPGD